MVRDASLDDFLDATGDQEAPADDDGADGDAGDECTAPDAVDRDGPECDGEDDPAVDPASVAAATPTYDWSPDGAACDGCGEVVERRWRDDPGLVCADCKAW